MRELIAWGTALLALGCSGSDDSGKTQAKLCAPGKVEACPCPAGAAPGVQACDGDGQGWGTCDCAAPDSGPPTVAIGTACSVDATCDPVHGQSCVLKATGGTCQIAVPRTYGQGCGRPEYECVEGVCNGTQCI